MKSKIIIPALLWIVAALLLTCKADACQICNAAEQRTQREMSQLLTYKAARKAVTSKIQSLDVFLEAIQSRKDLRKTEYAACAQSLKNLKASLAKVTKLQADNPRNEFAHMHMFKNMYIKLGKLEERLFNHAIPLITIH